MGTSGISVAQSHLNGYLPNDPAPHPYRKLPSIPIASIHRWAALQIFRSYTLSQIGISHLTLSCSTYVYLRSIRPFAGTGEPAIALLSGTNTSSLQLAIFTPQETLREHMRSSARMLNCAPVTFELACLMEWCGTHTR